MARQNYLNNLKVMLTLLVIFHHAGQAYGDGGDWGYTPSNPAEVMPWIWHFFSTNAAFFMGLYFFISGYFVPGSYDRQGFGTFVWKKILRLGVPLLLMGGLLTYFTGKVEIAHMWFVESLLIFSFFYAVVRKRCTVISNGCHSRPTLAGLFIVAIVMGIGSYLIRQASPQDHWISLGVWKFEPAHNLQYVMMFVLGILAYRFGWLDKVTNKTGVMALSIGGALAIGNYVRQDGAWNDFVWHWFGIYESLMCVFISFGLLWLFREKVNMSNKTMSWLSAQSYGAYIVHLPLMICIQNVFDGVWMGAFGKFMFIGVVTTVLSFILTWLLRLIPGVKRII
ncbi:MAG: acyltransferase family protein [Prevotella sp.]